jgi:hypothetical protein
MQGDVLQKFLDRGLLNLGEDPEKFNYVTSAAADLANKLKEDRHRLIRASSILVGPALDEREPLLESCAGAIGTHWPTWRGRFPSNATQLFRATLLQAIANITSEESDVECMAIVYYTSCGLIPLLTRDNEDAVLRDFVWALGSRLEVEAAKAWGSAKDRTVPSPEYADIRVAESSMNTNWLKDALKAAATNTGKPPNPHGVGTPDWGEHFAQNASNAIAVSVASVLKDLIPKLINHTRADDNALQVAISGTLNRLTSDRYSSEVVYWKESLFSQARSMSYRKMSADAAIYWAAHDLHNLAPRYHPESVEYFLRETIRVAIGCVASLTELTCADFCRELAKTPESIPLARRILPAQRLTLQEAAQLAARGQVDIESAVFQTGIPAEARMTREELAVWLFRDNQAARLAGDQ